MTAAYKIHEHAYDMVVVGAGGAVDVILDDDLQALLHVQEHRQHERRQQRRRQRTCDRGGGSAGVGAGHPDREHDEPRRQQRQRDRRQAQRPPVAGAVLRRAQALRAGQRMLQAHAATASAIHHSSAVKATVSAITA